MIRSLKWCLAAERESRSLHISNTPQTHIFKVVQKLTAAHCQWNEDPASTENPPHSRPPPPANGNNKGCWCINIERPWAQKNHKKPSIQTDWPKCYCNLCITKQTKKTPCRQVKFSYLNWYLSVKVTTPLTTVSRCIQIYPSTQLLWRGNFP